ncbi:MAG TPA: hypothetical protein VF933_06895 [Streptosporangiaceae bacterium]
MRQPDPRRPRDPRQDRIDCLVRDATGAPYLAWLNRKMRDRPAFFPISEALAAAIAGQQRRVRERYPDGSPWLFPAPQANLRGQKPTSGTRFRDELAIWLDRVQLTDVHGTPVKITCHQFRHTVGTSKEDGISGILQERRLGHEVPGMRGLYTHISDSMRRELTGALQTRWEDSLRARAAICPQSTVPLLDKLLVPYR